MSQVKNEIENHIMIPKTRQEKIEFLETYKQEIISEHETLLKRAKTMEKLKLSHMAENYLFIRGTEFDKLSDSELNRIVARLIASV